MIYINYVILMISAALFSNKIVMKYIHEDSLKWICASNVTDPDPFDEFEVLMIGVVSPRKHQASSTPHGLITLEVQTVHGCS